MPAKSADFKTNPSRIINILIRRLLIVYSETQSCFNTLIAPIKSLPIFSLIWAQLELSEIALSWSILGSRIFL